MKERKRHIRVGVGAVIFFVAFCILGTIVGIAINKHYYAMEIQEHKQIAPLNQGQEF
jgi:hypothetical protein